MAYMLRDCRAGVPSSSNGSVRVGTGQLAVVC